MSHLSNVMSHICQCPVILLSVSCHTSITVASHTHVSALSTPVSVVSLSTLLVQAKTSPTFKDVDFTQELGTIQIGEEARAEFLKKIDKDVEVCLCVHVYVCAWCGVVGGCVRLLQTGLHTLFCGAPTTRTTALLCSSCRSSI